LHSKLLEQTRNVPLMQESGLKRNDRNASVEQDIRFEACWKKRSALCYRRTGFSDARLGERALVQVAIFDGRTTIFMQGISEVRSRERRPHLQFREVDHGRSLVERVGLREKGTATLNGVFFWQLSSALRTFDLEKLELRKVR
jgi:hypothetical protein